MKYKICRCCNEKIANNAKQCPKCGAKYGIPTVVKILIIIGIIFVLMVACTAGCSGILNEAVEETKNSYNDVNGKTSFKINESFQNKYEKITMLEVNTNFTDYSEFLSPDDGYKVVMVKFEVENISKENDELYVSRLDFNAYADKTAIDDFYGANDGYNDLSATVGKGNKAVGYVFYEVPVNAQEITIEYNPNFWVDGNTIKFIVQ